MLLKTGWLRYLWKERKTSMIRQIIRMVKLHRTPFNFLLSNILNLVEINNAGFTFPISASIMLRNPFEINQILNYHQEIAVHGFNHINYRYLSIEEQRNDIDLSLITFRNMKIPVRGFRAPYNMYSLQTPKILNEFKFLWDAGIGFSKKYCNMRGFFKIKIEENESDFTCIPLCRWSDDRMIDVYGLEKKQMIKLLKNQMEITKRKKGVIMFDLHPIRLGQPQYIDLLEEILSYCQRMKGWSPTVTEAVNYWNKHGRWKDNASFCCLLTGDIDNFTFTEYLTRVF